MKQTLITLFLLQNILLGYALNGQTEDSPLVQLQTDRYCYVTGDVAFLKICYWEKLRNTNSQQTIYIDLVTSDAVFICGEVLVLKNGTASGYFAIPDSLSTGHYSFRVYTDISKLDANPILAQRELYLSNRFGKNEAIYSDTSFIFLNGEPSDSNITNSVCNLSFTKDVFGTRKKVKVDITLNTEVLADTIWASFTIKPLGVLEQQMEKRNVVNRTPNQKVTSIQYTKKETIKTSPGLMFRGKLVDSKTMEPIPEATVILSFQDSILRFHYDITDNQGNFHFRLSNYYGEQPAFLVAFTYPEMIPLKNTEFILFDNFLKPNPHSKPEKEVLRYQNSTDSLNLLKSVVSKAYQTQYFEYQTTPLRDTFSFENQFLAGKLTDVVLPDDFITLPDFVEMAREILPFIRFKKHGGTYRFSVIDGERNIVRRNPMVWVDGVPLLANDQIASWGTTKIKRVEVKSQSRVFGNLFFENGNVLIWTKELNFWVLNSYESNKEINLQLYQRPINLVFPDYSIPTESHLPDFRQTICWEPAVVITREKSYGFEFYTSDEKGKFEMILEGISQNGNPVYVRKIITVE